VAGVLSAVTFEKKPHLCNCNSEDLANAMTVLRTVADGELPQVLSPYQDSQTSVVLRSQEVQSVVEYLSATKNIEEIFIDHHVVKAFTEDSLITYMALRREDCYELYCSKDESNYMW
jgi:hypothetical protein